MTDEKPKTNIGATEFPEIVFGLVAPIGTDLNLLYQKLKKSLSSVEYNCELIHLIEHIPTYDKEISSAHDLFEEMKVKITLGTKSRQLTKRSDLLAGIAVREIQKIRERKNQSTDDNKKYFIPIPKLAYVIRQFKRREEVVALRETYGEGLFVISAYSSYSKRKERLSRLLGKGLATKNTDEKAEELIRIDEEEEGKGDFGQNLRETFPEGDFFVDMDQGEEDIADSIRRFIEIIFGVTKTPTREEYAMFHAHGTALTSASLARQVGACITTSDGDVVADGTNEVPKPKGGLYWDDDDKKLRDYELGYDINTKSKKLVFNEIAAALKDEKLIQEEPKEEWWDKIDNKSLLLDRLELSRTVHAEMAALMTAARLGIKISGCTLYTTTFPCHNCAKHIVAGGLKDVVYIEPYPKSFTSVLYPDSITLEQNDPHKIPFRPFIGISPRRYSTLFLMNHQTSPMKRKEKDGTAITPSSKSWKWRPRFGVETLTIETKENLLLSSFSGM